MRSANRDSFNTAVFQEESSWELLDLGQVWQLRKGFGLKHSGVKVIPVRAPHPILLKCQILDYCSTLAQSAPTFASKLLLA